MSKWSSGFPSIFADDSVLFCRAKEAECQVILDILVVYERGFGQKNLFFSSNTNPDLQTCIQWILGVPSIRNYEKQLGLLVLVDRAKKQSFIYIKEQIQKTLQGWKEKLLSQAGREVLIKSMIQVIPTHSMSYFKLPKWFIQEIETLICKFWQGYSGDNRKIH